MIHSMRIPEYLWKLLSRMSPMTHWFWKNEILTIDESLPGKVSYVESNFLEKLTTLRNNHINDRESVRLSVNITLTSEKKSGESYSIENEINQLQRVYVCVYIYK